MTVTDQIPWICLTIYQYTTHITILEQYRPKDFTRIASNSYKVFLSTYPLIIN